jgi:hypothetical protein
MKRTTILLLLTLFLMPTLSAFEVTVDEADSIYATEVARYHVTLLNTARADDTIEIDFDLDQKWSYETDPLTYLSLFTVPGKEQVEFDILVDPTSSFLSSGKYAVPLSFISHLDGDVIEVEVIMHIKNPDALTDYVPALSFVLDAQENIDPRNPAKVKLEIRNRNPLNITEMVVELTSDLYEDTKIVPIEPLGSTTVVFEVNYDRQQEPVDDLMELAVTVGDTQFSPIRKEISILGYEDVVAYQEPSFGWFFREKTVTEYTNHGNVEALEEIKTQVSMFSRWFTSTSPAGNVVDDNGLLYYVTTISIPINETVVVTQTVSYFRLLLLLLLVAAIVGLYYKFRSPILVEKETVTLHVDDEGRTKIKVLIHLKNRSMKLVDDVEIKDRIPAVAEIEKHFEMGTVKPTKILKHQKVGTMLVWNIHHLEAYEERIITYKVKSMYAIVGGLKLPSTHVKFKNGDGFRKVDSNKAKVVEK